MAKIEIRNAEVIRLIDGYGAVVAESQTSREGETKKSYFTIWTSDKVQVGDLLDIRGLLTVKLDEYVKDGQTQYKASANVNNPEIRKVEVTF